jgi:hypothetical protein
MRRIFIIFSLSVFLFFWKPSIALAWNASGHMVTGAIAYNELKQKDSPTLAKVVALLKQNPEFSSMWQQKLEQVEETQREQLLFMLAARWSDDIRGNSRYDRPKWHYINFPYKPDSEPASIVPPEPDPENILAAFQDNFKILNGDVDESKKAIALCWIFHLVGDVHQPLHTTALFSRQFPEGDRGGTQFFIKVKENSSTISLHRFWDDLIGSSRRFETVRNRATKLRLNPNYRRDALPELSERNFENWASQESFQLAKKIAYDNGTLIGSVDENNGKVLPSDYNSTTQTIAKKQIILAGYRLADLLEKI